MTTGFIDGLSAPARRALTNKGLTTLKKLAAHTENDVLALHGMGSASLPALRAALKAAGLSFARARSSSPAGMRMKNIDADTPAEYLAALSGWREAVVKALRKGVLAAGPKALEERLKWGHLVYFHNGPVLLIRAEPARVLFGFWRGQRLRDLDPGLKPGGKYEMATLELREGAKVPSVAKVKCLVKAAVALNTDFGDPTKGF